jgi:uncharacterized membrane protein YjjP (DUF1212 family)
MGEEIMEPPEEEPGDAVSGVALDLVLRVGELLLASGEVTERVNEAMLSLALAYDLPRCEVSVTLTVISVSVHPGKGAPPVTGARAIRRRNPAYWRLVALHTLVREASVGLLDLDQAHERLRSIKRNRPPYPPWLGVVALGLIAASTCVRIGGGAPVAGTAFVATVLADRAAALLGRRGVAEFFQLTVAASIGAASAVLVIAVGAPANAATIVTGAVVALLPGRPLVASIQDGITGDLLSAGARLLEVFFIVAAIVAGLGVTVYAAVHLGVAIDVRDVPAAPVTLRPVAVVAAAAVSATFAVSLAVPRRVLPAAALGGALIWTVYVLGRGLGARRAAGPPHRPAAARPRTPLHRAGDRAAAARHRAVPRNDPAERRRAVPRGADAHRRRLGRAGAGRGRQPRRGTGPRLPERGRRRLRPRRPPGRTPHPGLLAVCSCLRSLPGMGL